jgi:hypothetical protein
MPEEVGCFFFFLTRNQKSVSAGKEWHIFVELSPIPKPDGTFPSAAEGIEAALNQLAALKHVAKEIRIDGRKPLLGMSKHFFFYLLLIQFCCVFHRKNGHIRSAKDIVKDLSSISFQFSSRPLGTEANAVAACMEAYKANRLTWQALPGLLNTVLPNASQILSDLFLKDLSNFGIRFPDVQLRRRMFVNLMYERCQWLASYGRCAQSQYTSEADARANSHLNCAYFFKQLLLEAGTCRRTRWSCYCFSFRTHASETNLQYSDFIPSLPTCRSSLRARAEDVDRRHASGQPTVPQRECTSYPRILCA